MIKLKQIKDNMTEIELTLKYQLILAVIYLNMNICIYMNIIMKDLGYKPDTVEKVKF